MEGLTGLAAEVVACRACPRLVRWREAVGREKRRAYREEEYWSRPVPGFGDPDARLLVLGLAPAAHGANRTGRVFTGDRSGDWLYAGLHRAGFASRPISEGPGDGLVLRDAYITSAVKCAPPENRPLTEERERCHPYLIRELGALRRLKAVLCLGGFAWRQAFVGLAGAGHLVPRPRPAFGHGAVVEIENGLVVLGSYHPSQQNTFTGRLTVRMFDAVLTRAREVLAG